MNVPALALLLVLAIALGALGCAWNGPEPLACSVGSWPAAALSALAVVAVNNLPANVLLTPHPPVHMLALLIGLNLGPNLAVTGSLSAILWLRVARSLGATPRSEPIRRSAACSFPARSPPRSSHRRSSES